jgi:hypothetical protein
MKTSLPLLLAFVLIARLPAQNLTQTLRGQVFDADTKEALIGAEISIPGSDPFLVTFSDENGAFVLPGVPVGRQTVQCSYLGYGLFQRDNLQVNSVREYVLDIPLKAGIDLQEVVVGAYKPNEAVNELFVASARRIDPEELQYHAATALDPGRLVMGFPGVQPSRDSRSDIVIRGNSSAGVLWRLEGIDIPNPNHFARRGSSGGGITIFSASLLGSSDFSTGAFPAEYGNAFSGVFDMKFRHGNMHKREHTVRAGLLGLDIATEGPISEGKTSYLANFRYSTLGILNAAGIHLVGPRTDNNFQDFSFKIFHRGKRSQLSFWGIGGNSREDFRPNDLPWTSYSDYTAYRFDTRMGVIGASWNYLLDSRSYLQVHAGVMGQQIYVQNDTLDAASLRSPVNTEDFTTSQATVHAMYKRTFSPAMNIKAGIIATGMQFAMSQVRWNPATIAYDTLLDGRSDNQALFEGPVRQPLTLQPYVQWSYRPAKRWLINAGVHMLHASIGEGKTALEPRAAIRYELTDRSSLSLSYGMHSRVAPMGSYFVVRENAYPNKDLELIKASHWILAFQQRLGKTLNLQVETYYQQLWDVPAGLSSDRVYWTLNDVQGFATEPLASDGQGRNVGVDIYLEKFFDRGTFFVVSTSLFSSQFRVPNRDQWFNTQYNSQVTFTFTGGKTWSIGKNAFLESGLRLLFNAGNPITPVAAGFEGQDGEDPVLDLTRPFEDRIKPFIRPDARIALRKNTSKVAYWIALDIQNFINRRNEDAIEYEFNTDISRWGHRLQSPLTPLLTFEMHF